MPAAGGMFRYGIPEYRLPKKVLDHEIEIIRRKGVKFVYNCRIGQDVTFQTLQKDYAAIFISAGAQKEPQARREGEDKSPACSWRRISPEAASAKKPAVKGTVLVVGGGNVAVDVGPHRPAPRRQEGRDGLPRSARMKCPPTQEEIEAR